MQVVQVRPFDDKEAEEYKMVLYRFAERCSFHLSDIQVSFAFSESESWFGLVEFQMVRRLYLNGVNLVCFQVKDPNVLLLATFWMSPFL